MDSTIRPHHRLGLLCNPGAGRSRRDMNAIKRLAATLTNTVYEEATSLAEIENAVAKMDTANIDLLAINGGDGTVQAVLTWLLNRRPSRRLPQLLILPGGTTNMTAHDLGIRQRPLRILRRLHRQLQTGPLQLKSRRRPVIRVEHGTAAPVYGMFFGAGIIARGVDYFEHQVRSLKITGEKASAIAALVMLVSLVRKRVGNTGPAVPMQVRMGDTEAEQADYLLVLASALERLLFGCRPYWGSESAPLHCTAVRYPPRHLLRCLPALIRGRPGSAMTPAGGYCSHNLRHLELLFDGQYVIDGELYRASADNGPVRVNVADQCIEFAYLSRFD